MVSGLPAGLGETLLSLSPLAVAFSGGIDSRFLCHASRLCGADVLAVHVRGPHIPEAESEYARSWAESCKIPFAEIEFNPLLQPELAENPVQRCYFCKRQMLAAIRSFLQGIGQGERKLCDGSNKDDAAAFRPGSKAVLEAEVISPLGNLTKAEIRRHAAQTGMEHPEQAARPCLLTRLAYGLSPTPELLAQIAGCEKKLAELFASRLEKVPDFRLRMTPEPALHLTENIACLENEIAAILSRQGFPGCPIIMVEQLSGFFDRRPA